MFKYSDVFKHKIEDLVELHKYNEIETYHMRYGAI